MQYFEQVEYHHHGCAERADLVTSNHCGFYRQSQWTIKHCEIATGKNIHNNG